MRYSSLAAVLLLSLSAVLARAAEPTNDGAWKPVAVPDAWRNAPAAEKATLWYRCQVRVPADWAKLQILLLVESVDDAREVYFNGKRIGGLGTFPPKFKSGLGKTLEFKIPRESVRFGESNVVAIRVYYEEGRTGFNVAAPVLFGGEQAIRLAGSWETRVGDDPAWADPAAKPGVATDGLAKLEVAADVRTSLKKLQGEEGPLSPAASLAKLKAPDDLTVELALSEPEVRQPLSIKFDARGRMWVMQYLQYPNPAGLTVVSRDKFLRAVYDKVPVAPPNHERGADKITIHEDTDGDGKYDKHSTFVDGLSIATSFAFGKGGLWVLNPPYLLFYPDANEDDVPDGDPVVHLSGFGLEDTHSCANSLRWGPDGWLYGAQGSTVTGDIKRPGDNVPAHSLGQLIWRYHPPTRTYEIFAEGGGNTFGVEFDPQGRVYSGHNGGNTRGFHYVQGGYYQKGFGKHGALSNPFTFGYFEAMGHHDVERFTHTFIIYHGGALPEKYNGRLFGVAPLQGHVVQSEMMPDRSSWKTKDEGYLLKSSDSWCRPVDIQAGPDGAIYVADMYEQRIDHASHYQGRVHTASGRIYRVAAKGAKRHPPVNLAKLTNDELVKLLSHDNQWFRQTAQRLLADRTERPSAEKLAAELAATRGQTAVELLWVLNRAAGLPDSQVITSLDHADPYVRLWTVRLTCDKHAVSPEVAARLTELAYRETHVEVRSQLACSARRLPVATGLPIVKNLLGRSEDAGDIHVPLLLWWAVESWADKDREALLALFADKAIWDQPLVRDALAERLMRRFAATGVRKDLLTCAKLLELAPGKEHAAKLMAGFEAAYEGRTVANLPAELAAALAKAGSSSPTLKLRQGDPQAVADALKLVADEQADASRRQQFTQILGTISQPSAVPVLLKVARESRNDQLRGTALAALQSYNEPSIGKEVLAFYRNLPEEVRGAAQSLLASRANWAEELLAAIDAGKIEPMTIAEATVRKLYLHNSPRLAELCKKHFGPVSGTPVEELRKQIDEYVGKLGGGSGNPYQGKKLFSESCGKCHVLFAQGGKIGPDLTAYKRDDLRGLLLNVVNPSAEIREGFEQYVARTNDGRALVGFIADQDSQVVVLRGADGQNLSLARDEIEELRAVKQSLMPEGILKSLSDQQVRDLFAYLRSTQPLP